MKSVRLFILMLFISFAAVSAVLITPALPAITESLQISEPIASLTLGIFLIGYTIGQLPYGPLANRYGRKRALAIGLDIALVGAVITFYAKSLPVLCLGRFIQAIGAASGLKIAYTMIGDSYAKTDATKPFTIVLLSFAFGPALALALGGYLTENYGWQSCFAFLAGYSLLLNLLSRILPETAATYDPSALRLQKIAHALVKQFKNPYLILHAALMGFCGAIYYIFVTEAPYIAINQMGLSAESYGFWNLLPPIGMAVGLLSAAYISPRIAPRIGMLSGMLVSILGIIFMGLLFGSGFIEPSSLFIAMCFIQIGVALTYSYASIEAIGETEDKANGSAVIQFITIGILTASTLSVTYFSPITAPHLVVLFGGILMIQWMVWLKLKPHHQ